MSIITLSTDWGRTPNYKQVGELKGTRFIDHAIHCKEFWIRGKTIAQVLRPLLQVLCLVDGDDATSGYLYEIMVTSLMIVYRKFLVRGEVILFIQYM